MRLNCITLTVFSFLLTKTELKSSNLLLSLFKKSRLYRMMSGQTDRTMREEEERCCGQNNGDRQTDRRIMDRQMDRQTKIWNSWRVRKGHTDGTLDWTDWQTGWITDWAHRETYNSWNNYWTERQMNEFREKHRDKLTYQWMYRLTDKCVNR